MIGEEESFVPWWSWRRADVRLDVMESNFRKRLKSGKRVVGRLFREPLFEGVVRVAWRTSNWKGH